MSRGWAKLSPAFGLLPAGVTGPFFVTRFIVIFRVKAAAVFSDFCQSKCFCHRRIIVLCVDAWRSFAWCINYCNLSFSGDDYNDDDYDDYSVVLDDQDEDDLAALLLIMIML